MIGMTATLIDDCRAQVFRELFDAGDQFLHRPVRKLGAFHRCIEVVDVGLVVLGVMDLHCLRIDMRLKGIVGVRQCWQGIRHSMCSVEKSGSGCTMALQG